jgi:hypothetical protein
VLLTHNLSSNARLSNLGPSVGQTSAIDSQTITGRYQRAFVVPGPRGYAVQQA